MANITSNQPDPVMTTINKRPTKVLNTLSSSNGVLVACRLPNGEDVYVPLSEIFGLLAKEIRQSVRTNIGG